MSSDPVPSVPSSFNPPAAPRIKRRLKRVDPLSAGTTLALLYGTISLIVAPLLFIMTSAAAHSSGAHVGGGLAIGAWFAVAIPFLYGLIGFLTGAVGAALYNFLTRWTGGIEIELE
ncbi:hypothetical protein [Opitutus terrae]|uniref:DUF3566 domain-containing protein n=1 Tax=Opitutus terrae (strain DSM 11246 / JCM 15787 / PB90-1) TaxID=452637 RepID=B1ZSI8_OPITP|nr:hypothetical protein [Opitutus terrae]ACB73845.1 conserved hypothetical protein [Opitutus terrae PB90-1]